MTSREEALTDHYLELLSRTAEDHPWRAILFTPSHDGEEHVEFNEDGSWSTVVTDRGQEHRRERHSDLHELMFGLCAAATWDAAIQRVREPELHHHELEDRAQAAQVELMGRIDPTWANRLRRNYATWRAERARMAASDSVSDTMGRIPIAMIYLACALIAGGAMVFAWVAD